MKLGFIGAGNMATAVIEGLIADAFVKKEDILITTSTYAHTKEIATKLEITAKASNSQLVAEADIVIIAVKPHVVETVFAEVKETLDKHDPLIISLAAGLTLAQLQDLQSTTTAKRLSRVMPNINATIRKSVTAVANNELVTADDNALIVKIFQSIGSVYPTEEKDFQIFTALAGCSPAFTYLYIDAMSRAGVKNGLPKKLATQIATEAVLGSAQLLMASVNETPWDLIDKVCSPGGTTVAGILSLEDDAFMSTVIKGLDATISRDEELTNQHDTTK